MRLGLLAARKSSLFLFLTCSYIYICFSPYNDHRCQFPQITGEGLDDSIIHGAVRDYHSILLYIYP